MPKYDWRCAAGHEHEAYEDRHVHERECSQCLRPAQRQLSVVAGITGLVSTPTAYVPIPFSRYLEAQGEVVESARRAGVEPPDLWGAAQARIKRGDAKAIM